jgi:integrase
MPRDAGDDHHLYRNGSTWTVRIKLPKALGGRRVEFPTGTGDVKVARRIRDRLLVPLMEEQSTVEIARQLIGITAQADASADSLVRMANAELGVSVTKGPTLKQAADNFIINRRDFKRRSGGMVADYRETLNSLITVIGNPVLRDITSKDMRAFRDKMLVVRKFWNRADKRDLRAAPPEERLHPSTVIKMIRNISTFFRWAVKEEILDRNPMISVDLPTRPREHTPPPPRELADQLCTLPHPRSKIVGVLEWEVLPWFYRYTGARLGEVTQLTAEDVIIEHGVRCLRMLTEKTTLRAASRQGAKTRLVPVHPRLVPHLDRALERHPTGSLFPLVGNRWDQQLGQHRPGNEWSRMYNRNAKKVWDQMHVHCWRSYVVTETARAGIPEEVRMRLVGHVTRTVHQGYNAVDISRLKEAVEAIP